MTDSTFIQRASWNFGVFIFVMTVLATIIIGFTLKEITLTGEEVLHPARWIYAFTVFMTGTFSSLILCAISEGLSRLQEIEYYSEKTKQKISDMNYKASN